MDSRAKAMMSVALLRPWDIAKHIKETRPVQTSSAIPWIFRTLRFGAMFISGPQKGPAERGHVKKTSKIVKKCQKYFRHFSTFFAQGKKTSKSSKSVKFARHQFSGPFWGALSSRSAVPCACEGLGQLRGLGDRGSQPFVFCRPGRGRTPKSHRSVKWGSVQKFWPLLLGRIHGSSCPAISSQLLTHKERTTNLWLSALLCEGMVGDESNSEPQEKYILVEKAVDDAKVKCSNFLSVE